MTPPAVAGPVRAGRWIPLAFFLAAGTLFFFANRPAYKAYFSDDDLNQMGWPTLLSNGDFIHEILTPKFSENNFRPVGYLYYRYMAPAFKLNYRPWVAVLQAGHLLNVILLFFVLLRFGFSDFAAGVGALFYVFHAALIYIYWQPQYIFEVLCCMFCLITLLLYMRRHWILALITFWLAYKSKEIAVALPVALLAWEWFIGGRQWKRLIPYFLVSLNFGLQALWMNHTMAPGAEYALRFDPANVWRSIVFYSSAIVFLPYAGLALLLVPVFTRDRRVRVGLIFTAALSVPMLVLPSRLETVYWYIPMIGLTIVVAALATRVPRWAIAVFFLLWFPLNYHMMKPKRSELLAHGDQVRWYVNGLQEYSKHVPPLRAVVVQGIPSFMGYWGISGAIHQVFGLQVDVAWFKDPDVRKKLAEVPMAIVGYYPVTHTVKGLLRERDELESYVRFSGEPPGLQLGAGWSNDDAPYRWIGPEADLSLRRPAGSCEFEIVAFVPPESLQKDGPARIGVIEDDHPLGAQTLSESRPYPLRWKLAAGGAGDHRITIVTEPVRHRVGDPRDLGIAVSAIGYVSP
jgi:hypothetical protein